MFSKRFAGGSVVLLAIACGRPPAAETRQTPAPPAPALPATTPAPAAPALSAPVASSKPVPSASAEPTPPPDEPLVDAAGNALPQTEAKPSTTDERFKRRMELLARAIKEDDPSVALPSFFPLIAYQQVKAIQKPERDWKTRLVAAFERNVHEYHRALGAGAKDAQLTSVDVPEDKARWRKPGSEGNKIGYHRVLRSQLRFKLPDGKSKDMELTSMISWRGEWYVVHLNGFK
jgi:hypothetical protein